MDAPVETDGKSKLIEAQSNPVMSLRQARKDFHEADISYRKLLYEDLAVVYAAHAVLCDDLELWRDFVKIAEPFVIKSLSPEPQFPESLHCVVDFVFEGRHSPNRAYKFARALELLHREGVPAESVEKHLRMRGVDRLYYEATELLPRRKQKVTDEDYAALPASQHVKSVSADSSLDAHGRATETDIADDDDDDDDDFDDNHGEHDEEARDDAEREADKSPQPPRQPPVAKRLDGFDPERTLFVDCEPHRLRRVLKLGEDEIGILKITCTGVDTNGWKVISAVRFKKLKSK